MPEEDFDLESLARYLHIEASQVARMADRDKLPGRRIGGQWRFSPAEIHHWLEDRIGLSDEDQLLEVEGVLQRGGDLEETEDAGISISRLLPPEAIAIPLEARTRNSVITAMTELGARTGLLWDPAKMAEAVRARENLHPTALDNGVALLHPRRPLPTILAEAFVALGRSRGGIPFGGSRGTLTDVFFLICSTSDRDHLRALARLSRLIADPAVLTGLRAAVDARSAYEVIAEADRRLAS